MRRFLILHFLVSTSFQFRRIDPRSANIESDVIRKNRIDANKGVNPDSGDSTRAIESSVTNREDVPETAKNNAITVADDNKINDLSTQHNQPMDVPYNNTSTPNIPNFGGDLNSNQPFLPGSREDDPLTMLQSSEPLEKEIEKPIIHNSDTKYGGVNHNYTYVTNNFYNEKHKEEAMVQEYMWKRIYNLHDAIESLPPGIKKSQDPKEIGNKKKGLVITMDEKPTLTIDT